MDIDNDAGCFYANTMAIVSLPGRMQFRLQVGNVKSEASYSSFINLCLSLQQSIRFCYIARGSLTEVQSHMALARDLGYLSDDTYSRMTSHAESIAKQLNNYIAYLKRSKQGEKEYHAGYSLREASEPYILDDPNEDSPTH